MAKRGRPRKIDPRDAEIAELREKVASLQIEVETLRQGNAVSTTTIMDPPKDVEGETHG